MGMRLITNDKLQMMKIYFFIAVALFGGAFYACETAEDISNDMDHEVPSSVVLTDSLLVQAGQTVEIKIDVSDNAGLNKLVFSYGNWRLRESVSLEELNHPKTYRFETRLTIPEEAEKEWTEEAIMNTGDVYTVTQRYHKLNLEATDVNMNVRNIPLYIRVE
jgi:hypothetical protein